MITLYGMTMNEESLIRKQSWDLISLGLSTDEHGGKNDNTVWHDHE